MVEDFEVAAEEIGEAEGVSVAVVVVADVVVVVVVADSLHEAAVVAVVVAEVQKPYSCFKLLYVMCTVHGTKWPFRC